MQTIQFVREQLKQNREFLEGTLADVGEDEAHATPPGILNPISATYAHVIAGEDGFVNGLLRGGAPLFATSWAGRTGLSEPPADGPGLGRLGPAREGESSPAPRICRCGCGIDRRVVGHAFAG